MQLIDVNGDGIPDLITANYNGTVSILLGTGHGGFRPVRTFSDGLGGGVPVLSVAKVASTGQADIFVGNDAGNNLSILAGNGDGNFGAPQNVALNHSATSLVVADTNGDGKPDLMVGYSNGNFVTFLGNGTTTFNTTRVVPTTAGNGSVTSTQSGDFNGDGRPDLLVSDSDGSVSLLLSNSDGSLAPPVRLLSNSSSPFVSVSAVDVNGDRKPDLVAVSYDGTIRIRLGNGDGTFQATQTIAGTAAVAGASVGDVTGDGIPDLVLTNYLTGDINVLPGNGDGTFGTPVSFNVGGRPRSVTVGDVNGDGRADIIVSSYSTQSVSVLVNRSTAVPAIVSVNHGSLQAGITGTFAITTTGFPAGVVSETGRLPAGVILHRNANGTAFLEGRPAPSSGGTYVLTLSSRNSAGTSAAQTFTLTVDQARKFGSVRSATFTVGMPGTFTVKTSGFPLTGITETGAIPAGVTFTDNHDGTATFSGTPAAGTGATYGIVLSAGSRLGAMTSQNFTLTVDQPPLFTSASGIGFVVNTPATFAITTTGFPFATLTETGALPAGIRFRSGARGTATLSGKAAAGTARAYTLTFSASNGVGTKAIQTFTLTVT